MRWQRGSSVQLHASLIVIVLVAIGSAAFFSVFSLYEAVLLRSLPVKRPGDLLLLRWRSEEQPPQSVLARWFGDDEGAALPFYVFEAERRGCGTCTAVFGEAPVGNPVRPATVRARRAHITALGEAVTSGYFRGLGLAPAAGRFLGGAGTAPRVVLGYVQAKEMFGDPATAVGAAVIIDGRSFTVTGVAPRGFSGLEGGREAAFWVPFRSWGDLAGYAEAPATWWLTVFARVPRGFPAHVLAQIADAAVASRAGPLRPPWPGRAVFYAVSGRRGLDLASQAIGPLLGKITFSGAAALLLALGGALLVGLWSALSSQGDLAVRLALGAPRLRVCAGGGWDSLRPSAVGLALGLLGAWLWAGALRASLGSVVGRLGLVVPDPRLSWSLVAAVALLGLVSAALAGVVPAWCASRRAPAAVLAGRSAGAPGKGSAITLALLIAVGFALLSTSAMLARSVEALITAPLGFEANSLVFAETQPARGGTWRLDQGESFARAFLDLRRRAAVLPGVASASLATLVPFSGWSMALPVAAGGRSMSRPPALSMIGPNFFRTMGIRILLGRPPTPEEVRLGQPKAVVSQGLARVIAPDGSAIGKNLRVLGRQLEIVGVCADVEYRSIAGEAGPHLYIPFTLFSDLAANSPQALVLVVRAASGTSQVELDLRKRRFSPGISLTDVRSARSRVDDTVSEQMVLARAFGFLAALAFALLILAVYGFARSLLAVRRLQVAVRLALGCSLARARWSLAQALAVPLLAGVLAGLVLSWLSGRVMQAWIYRSGPASPLILALAFAAVLLAVWLALLGPWRTIVSMDLSTVLHQN